MNNKPIHQTYFDHRHIYVNQEIFYPIVHSVQNITKNTNTILISLDGKNNSLLNWNKEIEKAKLLVEEGYYILWEIDLGLNTPCFPVQDEMLFLSSKLALGHFVKEIWDQFKAHTLGISLYKGGVPSFSHKEESSSNVLQMNLLSDYLHLLAPFLPDDLVMMIFLDLSEIDSLSQLIYLTSKERFEFFLLAIKGKPLSYCLGFEKTSPMGVIASHTFDIKEKSPNVAVCFANQSMINDQRMQEYDEIFAMLDQNNINYRILPENFATEQWDLLDYIIASKSSLSDHGIRMMQGFSAAGGIPVNIDSPFGIHNEISFNQFLTTYHEKMLC